MKTLQTKILFAKFLGYEETSLEYKLKFTGCKNIEQLNKLDENVIPILVKDSHEPLFLNYFDVFINWNIIMNVVIKINELDITKLNKHLGQLKMNVNGSLYGVKSKNDVYKSCVEFLIEYYK